MGYETCTQTNNYENKIETESVISVVISFIEVKGNYMLRLGTLDIVLL